LAGRVDFVKDFSSDFKSVGDAVGDVVSTLPGSLSESPEALASDDSIAAESLGVTKPKRASNSWSRNSNHPQTHASTIESSQGNQLEPFRLSSLSALAIFKDLTRSSIEPRDSEDISRSFEARGEVFCGLNGVPNPIVKGKKRHHSTNATFFGGDLAFCHIKSFLFEPEALADVLRRGSASSSGSKSQGVAMQILP